MLVNISQYMGRPTAQHYLVRMSVVPRHFVSHSTFSMHRTNHFLHFSCICTFLEIIKYNMPKMLLIFFHLPY